MPPSENSRVYVCPHCERPVSGEVRGIAIWDGYDPDAEDPDFPIDVPTEYALVQCDRCGRPVLEYRENFGGGFDEDEPTAVYPAPRRLSWDIPAPIRTEWEEARTCFNAKSYTATVVMVRRTLEGVCRDNGVDERTLHDGLEALKSKGLIEGALASWAQALRVLGNRGAHYTGERVSRDDAQDALDFGEALLDHVYVFRRRFEAFMGRSVEDVEVEGGGAT